MELLLYSTLKNKHVTVDESESGSDLDDLLLLSLIKTEKRAKVRNYVKEVVLNYNLSDFQRHFRISKPSFQELMQSVGKRERYPVGRPGLPLFDSLLLTIWTLSNQESFRSIADRFGVGKGHAHRVFLSMCKKIHTKNYLYIKWPKGAKARETVIEFNTLRGENSFPNVFGCIDGTHIPIPGPLDDNSYYNRKGYHSVLLQVVCNAKQEFINVYCGWPGSVHDAKMWQHSQLYRKLEEVPHSMLPSGCYLLGDCAYPIKPYMIVPFKDNGTLTARQRQFNARLSSTSVVIEQAFGRLKSQFRRLKYLHMLRIEEIPYVLTSACVLHNISVKDDPEYLFVETSFDTDEYDDYNHWSGIEGGNDLNGIHLRNEILNKMF